MVGEVNVVRRRTTKPQESPAAAPLLEEEEPARLESVEPTVPGEDDPDGPGQVEVFYTVHFADGTTHEPRERTFVSVVLPLSELRLDSTVAEKALGDLSVQARVAELLETPVWIPSPSEGTRFFYPARSIVCVEATCGPIRWRNQP